MLQALLKRKAFSNKNNENALILLQAKIFLSSYKYIHMPN